MSSISLQLSSSSSSSLGILMLLQTSSHTQPHWNANLSLILNLSHFVFCRCRTIQGPTSWAKLNNRVFDKWLHFALSLARVLHRIFFMFWNVMFRRTAEDLLRSCSSTANYTQGGEKRTKAGRWFDSWNRWIKMFESVEFASPWLSCLAPMKSFAVFMLCLEIKKLKTFFSFWLWFN